MNVDFDDVRYLKTPPDEATLRDIIAKLEDPVENLVRKDAHFKELDLDDNDFVRNPDAVVAILLEHPKLLQRPIIVRGDKAIIGRPLVDEKANDRVTSLLS